VGAQYVSLEKDPTMLEDQRHSVADLAKRERRAWRYICIIAILIAATTYGFLWFTW
jgi:hypothetical protein